MKNKYQDGGNKGLDYLDKKYGKPFVVKTSLLGGDKYFPLINTAFLNKTREESPEDYITELSHYVQDKTNDKRVVSNNIFNKLNALQGLGYSEKGNVEYNAHSEIEPHLLNDYNKVMGKRLYSKKAVITANEKVVKSQQDKINKKDSLLNQMDSDDYDTRTNAGLELQNGNYFNDSRNGGVMGITDNLKFVYKQIKGVGKDIFNKNQMGGMIKRANGSYSKRGLWDNVRANKGSGKKPTSEMLKQERKINNKQVGGNNADDELMQLFNQFADSVDDDDFNTGEDVYNEYNKLSPDEQQQFIQSIQQQSQQQAPQQEVEQAPQEMQRGGKSGTDAVRKYQQMLNDKYGANLKIDGMWGKHTQSVYENSNLKGLSSKDNVSSIDNNPVLTNYKIPRINNGTTLQPIQRNFLNPERPQDFTGYSNINNWTNYFDNQQDSMDDYFNRVKPIKKYETKAKEIRAMMSPQEESDWMSSGGVGIRGSAMENRAWTSQNEIDFRSNKINRSGEKITPQQVEQSFDNAGMGLTQDKMDYILQERNKERKVSDIPSNWKDEDHDAYIKRMSNPRYNKQTGGIPTNENGYYELDPEENPIARIPSGRITMKNIPYKIKAVGGTTGKDYGYMQPEGEYNFSNEKFMYEIPKAQKGFDVNDYTRNKNLESLNSKEYQDYLAKIENEKNAKSLQDSMDAIKYKNTKGFITKDYFGGKDNTPFYNLPFTPNQNQNTVVTPTGVPANSNVPYKIKPTKSRGKKSFANVSATNTEVPNVAVSPKELKDPFTRQELDAQADESLKEMRGLNLPVSINSKDLYAHKDANVTDNSVPTNNKYIKGKSVTMNFDNPAEAQAIAYKKFKNSQSLAPYKQSVNLQSPGLYQENESAYLANIRENRNSALQNINPNSTIGQSAMSGVYAQGLNQENEAIGQVNKNNAQNTTNYLNQRSSINNQQQQMNNQYNDKYYNDVAQIESVKNQNDINYMDEISQMNAKRLQAKNRILANGIESGLGDALDVNDNSVTFDTSKIGAIINGGNNRKAAASSSNYNNKVNLKMIGGVPYHTYMDENGNAQATKVNIEKGQWGGMGKYKMKLK